MPAVFRVATTSGICSAASASAALSAATAISSPLTVNGPTSTWVLIRFLNSPVAGLQSFVFSPGMPNICSIVLSEADDRPLLKVLVGGIGITSLGLGEGGTAALRTAVVLRVDFFDALRVDFFAALAMCIP